MVGVQTKLKRLIRADIVQEIELDEVNLRNREKVAARSHPWYIASWLNGRFGRFRLINQKEKEIFNVEEDFDCIIYFISLSGL